MEWLDDAVRQIDIATALVDTARAAQELLRDGRESDDNPMLFIASSADADDLRVALNRWLTLTGQEGAVT